MVFEYPNISAMGVIDEANFDDQFDCRLGGAAHQGVFGPFGLLVLTDDNFQEQTAVFFYIAHKSDGQWTTKFCSDQSRYILFQVQNENLRSRKSSVRFFLQPRIVLKNHKRVCQKSNDIIHYWKFQEQENLIVCCTYLSCADHLCSMMLRRQCMAVMSQSCPQKIFCLSVSL